MSDSVSEHGHIPFAFWCVGTVQPRILVELGTSTSDSAGNMAESSHVPGVTVVMPCLHERITIAEAVVQAKAAFAHWPGVWGRRG